MEMSCSVHVHQFSYEKLTSKKHLKQFKLKHRLVHFEKEMSMLLMTHKHNLDSKFASLGAFYSLLTALFR